ncbi:hypothetical protein KPL74_03985 [Bacillus sp. NP157]|nr:hypothetical protein KPL74_03985 [Bacillus sp. NP157]
MFDRKGDIAARHYHAAPRKVALFLRRAFVKALLLSMPFSATVVAGSVTMRTVTNLNGPVCAALKRMIVGANIQRMSDQDLCTFRFSKLPPSKTEGFVFPRWSEFTVSDPVATFTTFLKGDRWSSSGETSPMDFTAPNRSVSPSQLAVLRGLTFSRTQVRLLGAKEEMTLVSVDVPGCRNAAIENDIAVPAIFAFRDDGRVYQEQTRPTSRETGGEEIAFWKGNIPVRLSIFNAWVRPKNLDTSGVVIELMELSRRGDSSQGEYLFAYPTCAFSLEKKV